MSRFTIKKNIPLTPDVWRMELTGDTSAITAPGQFVNVLLDNHYLRRPFSVCDWDEGELILLYKILGRGTQEMTGYPIGKTLDFLTGLGNGYDLTPSGQMPLLVGGGVGIPPLYGLARRLRAKGKQPIAALGFNRAADIFLVDKFAALGVPVTVATADGSAGIHGMVTAAMPEDYSYLYCCGPEPMLHAVWDVCRTSGQFSFEERMGCGFGACMGCTHQTANGPIRICREGPVLRKEEILWPT